MNRHEGRRAKAMGGRNVFDADSATVIKASRYAGLVVIATAATGRRRGARQMGLLRAGFAARTLAKRFHKTSRRRRPCHGSSKLRSKSAQTRPAP
jgi:hypothetical protein